VSDILSRHGLPCTQVQHEQQSANAEAVVVEHITAPVVNDDNIVEFLPSAKQWRGAGPRADGAGISAPSARRLS